MSQDDVGLCGCYVKTKKRTPANLSNPPGLSALKYRVGTHSQFKADMINLILRKPALEKLTTRDDNDLGIALLDSWATIADVLTFYQERIANEGYLRTATERRSVLELARTIGYELKTGVAASVPLVFTVESSAGSSLQSRVDEGTKVMSVPGQDEKLQVFETVETLEAKAALNDLKPLRFAPQKVGLDCTELYLKGVNTHLVPGDAILFVGSERLANGVGSKCWDFRFIHTVKVYPDKNCTCVTWKKPLGPRKKSEKVSERESCHVANPEVFVFRQRVSFFGYNAPDWKVMPDSIKIAYDDSKAQLNDALRKTVLDVDSDLVEMDKTFQGGDESSVNRSNNLSGYPSTEVKGDSNESQTSQVYDGALSNWPGFDKLFGVVGVAKKVFVPLDAVYSKVLPESWVVFAGQRERRRKENGDPFFCVTLCRVAQVEVGAQSDFTLNAKTTKLELDITDRKAEKYLDGFMRRDTVVFCVSESLEITDKPLNDPVSGNEIVLDRKVSELKEGQKIVVQGIVVKTGNNNADADVAVVGGGEASLVSEGALIKSLVQSEYGTTKIVLEVPDGKEFALSNKYDLASVHVYANVAFATHGETVHETLGSGSSLEVNQQFRLKKTPLTFVSAATPSGAKSTLKVYVNDVQWQGVSTLNGSGSKDFDYFVRVEDNGDTLVSFGDGVTGARLPSGVENVMAVYRSGIGLQGVVGANKLTLLTKKPFGIRSVTNPIAASGAAAPEKMEDAKVNAPSTVLTLGRIVSLKDYENFARNFLGIAKASAHAELKNGAYIVRLIVAPVDAKSFDDTSMLSRNLKRAIDGVCAYGQKVCVESFTPVYFNVFCRLYVDSNYRSEDVKVNVKVALVDAFSFEKRSFRQVVTSDEVLAEIQKVPGVIYVDDDFKITAATTFDATVKVTPTDTGFKYSPLKADVLLMINFEGIILGVKE